MSEIPNAPAEEIAARLGLGIEDARAVRDPFRLPDIARAVAVQRDASVTLIDDDYPTLLKETADPPLVLFLRGLRGLLDAPAIAIVGTRTPTPYGINAARRLTRDLALRGWNIVSGLARGIDAVAHREALEQNRPTIAILGTGLDVCYPREHRSLAASIEQAGALVTEFPLGTPPRAANFPIRNRIIAGLVKGVVVVEASEKSGSLITARLATEQNREVFAVPGPIFSAQSIGPHRLIQAGAKLLQDVDDLIDELGELQRVSSSTDSMPSHPLLEALSLTEARHIDHLVEATRSTPSELAEALLRLEIDGRVMALPGSRYVRLA